MSKLVQSSKISPQLLVRRINKRASQYSKHAEKRTCGESKEARKIAGTQQSRKERENYSILDKKKSIDTITVAFAPNWRACTQKEIRI